MTDKPKAPNIEWAEERIGYMAERWRRTPVWHEPPFYGGTIKVTTEDLHAATVLLDALAAARSRVNEAERSKDNAHRDLNEERFRAKDRRDRDSAVIIELTKAGDKAKAALETRDAEVARAKGALERIRDMNPPKQLADILAANVVIENMVVVAEEALDPTSRYNREATTPAVPGRLPRRSR